MAYSEQVRRAAADTLQRRRNRAKIRQEQTQRRLLAEIPALAENRQRVAALGVELLKLSLLQDQSAMKEIQAQIDQLGLEQAAMLREAGYSADALELKPYCPKCGDTGTLPNGEKCDCVRALLQSLSLDEIARISPLGLSSFEDFSLDYYSAGIDAEYGMSPRENARDNLNRCREFAARFPAAGENLLLLGDAGLGKTHLALAIARKVLERGFDVIYCSAASVFRQIEKEHFDGGHETATLDSLKRCELLVLDDLGAEFNGPFVTSALYDIINTRIIERRSTIYTSNIVEESDFMRRYGEKISSRLLGCCAILPFWGEDIRKLKAAQSDNI